MDCIIKLYKTNTESGNRPRSKYPACAACRVCVNCVRKCEPHGLHGERKWVKADDTETQMDGMAILARVLAMTALPVGALACKYANEYCPECEGNTSVKKCCYGSVTRVSAVCPHSHAQGFGCVRVQEFRGTKKVCQSSPSHTIIMRGTHLWEEYHASAVCAGCGGFAACTLCASHAPSIG